MTAPPNKSLQPLELVGKRQTEPSRVVCDCKPPSRVRICSPAASRSDALPVAVRLQPTESAARPLPRRVATIDRFIGKPRVVLCCSPRVTELTYIL
jgi:hypothetical protein